MGCASPEPAFISDGLMAYYPFNGNAKDESGNGTECVDTVTVDSVPPGAILLVCLDGDDKTFRENYGMQVILNNAD